MMATTQSCITEMQFSSHYCAFSVVQSMLTTDVNIHYSKQKSLIFRQWVCLRPISSNTIQIWNYRIKINVRTQKQIFEKVEVNCYS